MLQGNPTPQLTKASQMKQTKTRPDSAPARKTVATFRELHDRNVIIPKKIRETLDAMKAKDGPEAWEYEADFIRLAGIGGSDLNAHRDEFAEHIVEAKPIGKGNTRSPRRVWFATVKAAKSARGE
jgi:hypothetical protein